MYKLTYHSLAGVENTVYVQDVRVEHDAPNIPFIKMECNSKGWIDIKMQEPRTFKIRHNKED